MNRRYALLIGLAAIVAVLAVVTGIVLTTGDDDEPEAAAATTTTSTPAPVVTEPAAEATDLEDGRHPAFITALDVDGGTVEVDVIQFLTGEEARAAYEQETGDPGGPPNDYYIKNENARLRTLPLDADVQVTIDPDGGRPRTCLLYTSDAADE